MSFIQRPYIPGETIAAIATPIGEGGISIIRISGDQAVQVASRLCSKKIFGYASHTAHLSALYDLNGTRIDEALILVMLGKKSYTGEDTVELQCHGGIIASRKVLEACFAAGARAAMPGEFTFKAFMNGRIDLAQAEAVQKLISAKNEQAFSEAGKQLSGVLSETISSFQDDLVRLAAILEAWVDFPEEGIEWMDQDEIILQLKQIRKDIQELLETFHDGKKLEEGISLCIVGPPNAGKSSLLNALLDQERAIVTPIAGTTRDLLHEEMTIGGLHFKLTDTAGIRYTDEVIEQEGIRRSKQAAAAADLVILVLDASTDELCAENQEIFPLLPVDKTIVVWNKIDLASCSVCQTPFPIELNISAKKRIGLEELKKAIGKFVWKNGGPPQKEVMITTLRHQEALILTIESLNKVIEGLNHQISPEFLAADMRSALEALGRMMGTNITEDILSSIFSQFCIGK
jgi:tRNA modification GTPase